MCKAPKSLYATWGRTDTIEPCHWKVALLDEDSVIIRRGAGDVFNV